MISDQANFLQSLGWAALNSLWQMALLWILFQFINGIFRIKSSTRSSMAASLLIGGFIWFIYTFISTLSISADIALFTSGVINMQGDPQINNWLLQALPIATIIYLSLLIFPILRFVKNYRYVQIIRRYGLSKINVDSRIYINKTAIHLGIKRKVQIWISELVSSPVTIGFLKPVILVPLAAINNLSTEQLEAVLLHELAHIKRSDYLINLLLNIIQTILYFNPFVKAFIKLTETEREKSCDELVLQFQYNSHEYASALLALEKANQTQPVLALAASGVKNDLLHRIENILNVQKKNILSTRKISGLLVTICFIISINIAFLFSQHFSSTALPTENAIFGVSKYLFDENRVAENNPIEVNTTTIINTPKISPDNSTKDAKENVAENFISNIVTPELINVALTFTEIPELKKYQEEQIKSALESSKRVLETNQWKSVEKNIADVFTQKEKEELKADYQKEIEKFDWSKWENRLRTAYDHVNWEKVNSQLNNAIKEIRIDSLQTVYANVAIRLNEVQKELASKKLTGVPDSDISLENIIEKKEMVQRILNELRKVRTKKIVEL